MTAKWLAFFVCPLPLTVDSLQATRRIAISASRMSSQRSSGVVQRRAERNGFSEFSDWETPLVFCLYYFLLGKNVGRLLKAFSTIVGWVG